MAFTISKLIGKKAKPCGKCQSLIHWVNTVGGVFCVHCRPDVSNSSIGELTIAHSTWCIVGDEGSVIPPSTSLQRHAANGITPQMHNLVVSPNSRGIDGRLSEREEELFFSDKVWGTRDQWIVYKPKPRSSPRPEVTKLKFNELQGELPECGTEILLSNSMQQFGGVVPQGSVLTVSKAHRDGFGNVVVSLSASDREVISGASWPIGEIVNAIATGPRVPLPLDLL